MRESDPTLISGPELWAPQLGPTTRRVMPPKAAEVDPDHKEAGGRTSGVPHWTPVENMVRRALPGLWGPTGRRLCTNRCWWGPKTRRARLKCVLCAALRRACSPSLLPMRPRRSRLWFSEEALPNLRIGYPQGTGSVGPRFGSVRLIVCGVPFLQPSWRRSRPAHAPEPAPQQRHLADCDPDRGCRLPSPSPSPAALARTLPRPPPSVQSSPYSGAPSRACCAACR